MKKKAILFFFILTFLYSEENKLIIFHAGSLAKPFKELKYEFEKKNKNITVFLEAAGSIECARKIRDLKKDCDLFASSDEFVISEYLIPEYASWSIEFLTNEIVIMFTSKSKFNKEINSSNWYDILLRKGVEYGHSDPDKDPCGYRSLQVWQLAEIYYKKENLFNQLKDNCPMKNIRPKEVDMLSLLETNEIDYLFIYRSVAVQHNGLYLTLPDKINLGNEDLKDFYKNAIVEIRGKTEDQKIKQIASPIKYSLTIPVSSKNKNLAIKFVEFLTTEEARKIFETNGHKIITPMISKYYDNLPIILKKYVRQVQ
ncbi:MAG TPA: extracellular solute-binding protein [Spirochaetota bacterium]|nr:extracellular solute-binding protein [Spirochaetota bacterium]HOL58046.1 extracellular solute-binding protein [Spirochaetota bacterium]HPP04090.1 extracellular solute-binding protein [Spirochaetota bacterium]